MHAQIRPLRVSSSALIQATTTAFSIPIQHVLFVPQVLCEIFHTVSNTRANIEVDGYFPYNALEIACCLAQRKQRGYLTIEEEEDGILEQKLLQQQQYPNSTTKPSTAAAAPSTGNRSRGFNLAATTKEPTTPARTRGKSAAVSASSPSSRRPVTAATKPREVVVGRDFSLGRQPPPPPNAAASSPGAGDKQIGRDPAAAAGGAGANTGRGGPRGRTAISVPTRGGGEAVVVVPKRPRPIWFAGSGAVQAEWSALPGGARVVRDLEGLEEQGR